MKSSFYDIPLKNIIHNDLETYIKSGYGGKHIKNWPFYYFIKMWVKGDRENAENLWVNWLVNEFLKYRFVIKSRGGMYHGSVHKYSLNFLNNNKQEYWLDPSKITKSIVQKGAKKLVVRRIKMIKSVINKGYKFNQNDPIFAVKKGNLYVLKGGHHRASIMHILGYDNLPKVKVYSKLLWELREWLSKLKKLLNLKI